MIIKCCESRSSRHASPQDQEVNRICGELHCTGAARSTPTRPMSTAHPCMPNAVDLLPEARRAEGAREKRSHCKLIRWAWPLPEEGKWMRARRMRNRHGSLSCLWSNDASQSGALAALGWGFRNTSPGRLAQTQRMKVRTRCVALLTTCFA